MKLRALIVFVLAVVYLLAWSVSFLLALTIVGSWIEFVSVVVAFFGSLSLLVRDGQDFSDGSIPEDQIPAAVAKLKR